MEMVEQRQIQSPKYDIKRQHENSRKEKRFAQNTIWIQVILIKIINQPQIHTTPPKKSSLIYTSKKSLYVHKYCFSQLK